MGRLCISYVTFLWMELGMTYEKVLLNNEFIANLCLPEVSEVPAH